MLHFNQYRALVVDDEPSARKLLKAIFQAVGFGDFVACADGAEALTELQRSRFDLALIDVNLGAISGLKVAMAIRKRAILQDTRIVMTTASRDYNLPLYSKRAGADDFILKPFPPKTLIERLIRFFPGPTFA